MDDAAVMLFRCSPRHYKGREHLSYQLVESHRHLEILRLAGDPPDVMRLAIRIAFVRRRLRRNSADLPPVRSLAYYRADGAILTPDERLPVYANSIG